MISRCKIAGLLALLAVDAGQVVSSDRPLESRYDPAVMSDAGNASQHQVCPGGARSSDGIASPIARSATS
jgi:hypothetical protein